MNNKIVQPDGSDGRLQSRQVEMILSQLDALPTLPEVATQLLHLTSSDRSNAAEVIELIRADQSLTARILSLAARVDAGIRREARTISKAVVLLGFETIRSIVMSIKVFEMFEPADGPVEGLDRREFWKHCVAVACAAELLATRCRDGLDPEELFVCGLLHDIGKLALEQCLPKSYTRIVQTCNSQCSDIAIFERELIGVDHTVAGRRLAQIWQLPPIVENVIWLHHQDPSAISDDFEGARAVALVNLADTIAREHRFGYSGNFSFPADSMELAGRLGISGAALGDTIDKLPGTIEKRAQMMGLGETTSESLFRAALANANEELGRLNRKYHARSVQASVSTRGLKHLLGFARSLSGRDTVARVAMQIASTWNELCNFDPQDGLFAAAYILSRRDDSAILARCGADGKTTDLLTTRNDLPMIRPPAEGIAASQAIETFIADTQAVPEWLADPAFVHKPLVCGSVWVGGLIWPAEIATIDLSGDALESLCATMAFAASATEMRDRGQAVAEQVATMSQKLYQAQRSLAESRTLAVVGEMAAGAAHEINNPLTVISGRAQLMAAKSPEPDNELWRNIADQAQTISDIVTDLMAFARPGSPRPVDIKVSELVSDAVDSYLDDDENPDIEIKTDIQSASLSVRVDPAQITSVLSELLINAGRSFDKGAKEEETKRKSGATDVPDCIVVEAASNPRDGQVLIKVIDTGRGMDSHVLDQAFTPFFSSMKAGRHRGMGLSRAKRFVELAGGKIWIKSAPGAGSTVYVSLPAGKGPEIVEQSDE